MKILISTASFAEYDGKPLELLKQTGFEIVLNPYKRKLKPEEVIALANDCTGIIAGTEALGADVLEKLPKLKAISRCGAGMDNVDLDAAKKLGITVTGTPNAPTQAVAELALALMLDLLRRTTVMDRQVREGKWSKIMGSLLTGKTIGIIGLGRIGRQVVELLKPFGCRVIACEPQPDKKWVAAHDVELFSLDELLRQSDIVTLHIPYSKESHHLLNAEKLKLMKSSAMLINAARGGLVDEDALYDALKTGNIAGAALDVTEAEPYKGPLTELKEHNIILTPHIGSYAREARIEMETEAVKNLIAMLKEKRTGN